MIQFSREVMVSDLLVGYYIRLELTNNNLIFNENVLAFEAWSFLWYVKELKKGFRYN